AGPPLFPYTTLFRSEPVEVILLAAQQVFEDLLGAVVTVLAAQRHRAVVALDRCAFEVEVDLELLGHGLADSHGAEALQVGHAFRSEEHTSELQSREN